MPTLFLVRHGQARFGSDDYDRLSPLGVQQCEALGAWLAGRGQRFGAVLRGTLVRHAQSLEAIAAGYAAAGGGALPAHAERRALDEYDSEAVIRAVHAAALQPAQTPEQARAHFRLLREGLLAWAAGRAAPAGMPAWSEWVARIAGVLEDVRGGAPGPGEGGGDVLVVSSGGPISTAVAHVLGAPAEAFVELNLRLRNSSLTEFSFTPKRHSLLAFNQIPHLQAPDRRAWETWA